MSQFLWPFVAFILPLPFLVRWLFPPVRTAGEENQADALRVSFFYRFEKVKRTTQPIQIQPLSFFLMASWICLVLAGMRPIRYEDEIPLQHEARNIMLAIDFSTSMAKRDFGFGNRPVPRIDVVKSVVRDFIAKRSGDRMGLVIFGTTAHTLAPLSLDMQTLDELFADVGLGIAGEQTAIGDALALAVQDTAKVPDGEKIIILLSDGYSNAGDISVKQAIELAKSQKIAVYTIGIGSTANGVPDWDEEALTEIAKKTGGQYFRAKSAKDLENVYQKINELETVSVDGYTVRPRKELFFYPLTAALLFWILAQRRNR